MRIIAFTCVGANVNLKPTVASKDLMAEAAFVLEEGVIGGVLGPVEDGARLLNRPGRRASRGRR